MPAHLVQKSWPQTMRVWELAPENCRGNFATLPNQLCEREPPLPDAYTPKVSAPLRVITIEHELTLPRYTGRLPECSTGQSSSALGASFEEHTACTELRKRNLPKVVLGVEWGQRSYDLSIPETATAWAQNSSKHGSDAFSMAPAAGEGSARRHWSTGFQL